MNVCYFTFAKSLYLQRTSSLQYPNEIAWAPYHVPWEIQAQTRACRNYMHTLSLSRFSLSKAPQGVMFLVVDMCSELPLSTSLLKDCWHSGLCGRSTKRSCPAFREDRRQWLNNTLTDGLKNHPFASRGDQLRGGIHAPELIKGSDPSQPLPRSHPWGAFLSFPALVLPLPFSKHCLKTSLSQQSLTQVLLLGNQT